MTQPLPLAEQTVLVTGAGGFIGNHIVRELQAKCRFVKALSGEGDDVRSWNDNVEASTVDVRDAMQLKQHCREVQTVVHLAGPPSVRDSFQHAQFYADIHTGGTANMLQVAQACGVQRFVYVSSAEVYGQPISNPVKETHRLLARSPYAAAKLGAERYVESFTQFADLEAVIVRPFSIFGPGQSLNSLLGTIIKQLASDSVIELADLSPIRDYCFVGDLALAISKACYVPIERLTILNIGSGVGTSVESFANLAARAAGKELEVRQAKSSDRPEKANIYELVANVEQAGSVLGWQPQVSLQEGLRRTIEFVGVAS